MNNLEGNFEGDGAIENPGRRSFLRTAPAAAAAGLALGEALGSHAAAQETVPGPESRYKVITAETLDAEIAALDAQPANKTIVQDKYFEIILTVEKGTGGKEFEWHEHRDHVINILDGSTDYELGGTPQKTHSPRPGEWLAPVSEGAAKVTLHKGDTLVIQRMTPHKRTTPGSVTLTLTAPMTPTTA